MLTQFFKREENQVLFNFYGLICEQVDRDRGLSYLEIQRRFN